MILVVEPERRERADRGDFGAVAVDHVDEVLEVLTTTAGAPHLADRDRPGAVFVQAFRARMGHPDDNHLPHSFGRGSVGGLRNSPIPSAPAGTPSFTIAAPTPAAPTASVEAAIASAAKATIRKPM